MISSDSVCTAISVLIETYWNVNLIGALGGLNYRRINRNILECKFKTYIKFLNVSAVLIETYWNVNVSRTGL